MGRISFVLALPFLAVAGMVALAQPVPLATLQNSNLFFAAATLTTNGIPGLTNVAPRLLVSGVTAASAHGGSVSLVNTQVWVRRYKGEYNSYDQALKVVVDHSGNVCVTGDSSSQSSDYDMATVKYAVDGTPLWTNRYDGPAHGYDSAWYEAADGADNMYVSGHSAGFGTANDIVTIKYSPAGTALWTNRYNQSGTNYHQSAGMAVDDAGNAYVLVDTAYTSSDYTTLKYDALGNAVWTNHFTASTDSSVYPVSVAVDQNGGVFVTGSGSGSSIATLKYASDGTGIWTNYFHLPGIFPAGYAAQPTALAVDRSGNVTVTGNLFTNPRQYVTLKYANDGTPLWTNLLATPRYQGGNVPDVAADLDGNVFVVGGTPGASGAEIDFSTTKIAGNGIPLWTNRYADLNNTGNGYLGDMTVDNAGNCYLTGHSTGPGGTNLDYTTVKIAANGCAVWTNRYDGPAHGSDSAMGLAADDAGNIYVTGQSDNGLGNQDFATVKYADYISYNPPADFIGTDSFAFTVVDNMGNLATGVVTVVVSPNSPWFNTGSTNFQFTAQGLRLQVDGARGAGPVILYASSNLVNWQSIDTNPPTLGSAFFLDSAATNQSKRFYRALQQP